MIIFVPNFILAFNNLLLPNAIVIYGTGSQNFKSDVDPQCDFRYQIDFIINLI